MLANLQGKKSTNDIFYVNKSNEKGWYTFVSNINHVVMEHCLSKWGFLEKCMDWVVVRRKG